MQKFTKFALVVLLVLSTSMTLALALKEQQLPQSNLLIPQAAAAASVADAEEIIVAAAEEAVDKNDAADTADKAGVTAESADKADGTADTADAAAAEETESDSKWSISETIFNNISTIVITVLGLAMCVYLYITNNRVK